MENTTSEINFKSFLQNEFIDRCRKNGSYSLRSFARTLKVSPAALSEMINGKRPITPKTKAKIALLLRLSPEQLNQIDGAPFRTKPALQYDQMTVDSFALIADWYHFAIMELLALKNFKEDIRWISHTLSITPTEATIALERLLRLGLLKRDSKGKLKDGTSGFTTSLNKGQTSEAAQRFQKQALQKAIDAIGQVPLEYRDNTSMTFAINTEDLDKARQKIEAFRREMNAFFQLAASFDEVYQLSVALFPLSRAASENKKIKKSKGSQK